MTDTPTVTPLYDVAYVRNCVEKAIEKVSEDYAFDGENVYYHLEIENDEITSIEPACLVGQVLEQIGVDDDTEVRIARMYNSTAFSELVQKEFLPVDEPAIEFLREVQRLNDSGVPWHRILGELPA